MFDLTKDLPIPESANGVEQVEATTPKKRKRGLAKELLPKGLSGAGSAVPPKEVPVTKMRKFNSGPKAPNQATWINHHMPNPCESDEEDDDEHRVLTTLRRSTAQDGVANHMAGDKTSLDEKNLMERQGIDGDLEQQKQKAEHWWHTFKYRPILGMVPIGVDSEALEVVLVERPSWELDLPPRFVGTHER